MRYLVIILCFALAACSSEHCRNGKLLKADSLCFQNPHLVVRELSYVDVNSFTLDADRALYSLVFTEAVHRVGFALKSDSLVAFSQQFYEKNGDDRRLARACLHRGIILYGMQRYGEAFRLLKRSEEMARNLGDDAIDYELFAVMGDINDNANNNPLTLDYYHRSLRAAERLGSAECIARQLNNIATVFDEVDEPDSLKLYNDRCLPLLDSIDGTVRATLLSNIGSYYLRKGNLPKAKEYLLKSKQTSYIDKTIKLLGDIAEREGDMNHACMYWSQMQQSPNNSIRIDSHRRLIAYYERMASQDSNHSNMYYAMALNLSQRLNSFYSENYEKSDVAGIIDMQQQYDKQQKERHQYRLTICLLTALIIAIIIAVIVAWYYIASHRELVQMQRQKVVQARENSRQMKDVVARLHKSADRGVPAPDDDLSTLAQLSYAASPALLSLLKPLGSREQAVCLLIRQHFQPTEIAILTSLSPQSVTNLRVRLLQKLFGMNGGAKDFDYQVCMV